MHTLADLGFCVIQADPGVFHLQARERTLILAVHVDNCIITGTSATLIATHKEKLNAWYALMDLGPVYWLLRVKITHNRVECRISLSQTTYIDTIITCFGLTDTQPQPMPMLPNAVYSKDDSPSDLTHTTCMKKVPYQEVVGSLMYATVVMRPDISFTVSTLSQFLENLGEHHWDAVKRIF